MTDPERRETAAPVRIASVTLSQFAGVSPDAAFTVPEFGPGINIVTGPNGCGKTTTARAMQTLLWPDRPLRDLLGLKAEIVQGATAWTLHTRGRQVEAVRDGQSRDHPAWAPSETRGRYHWSLRNLLAEDDRELARRIATEMAGGVDFEDLARRLGLDKPPSRPVKLQQEYQEAEKRVREARETQQALRNEADELDRLEAERERAADTARRLPLVENAIDLRGKQRRLRELRDRLDQAPPNMEKVRGDDAAQLEDWLKNREALAGELRELDERTGQLGEGEADWTTLGPDRFREARRRMDQLCKQLGEAEARVASAEERLLETETRERRLRERLRLGGVAATELESGYRTPELRTWIQRVLALLGLREQAASAAKALPPPSDPPPPDPERVRDARRDLNAWLVAAAPPAPLPRSPFYLSWLTLLGLVLFLTLRHNLSPWLGLLLLPPLLLHIRLEKRSANRWLLELQARVPADLVRPAAWTGAGVRESLRRLDDLEQQAHRDRLRGEEENRLRRLEEGLARAEAELRAVTEPLAGRGLDPEPDPLWIAHFLEDVQAWRKLREETAVAEARLAEAESGHSGACRELEALLTEWAAARSDRDPLARAEELSERMERELERRRRLGDLQTRRRHAEERRRDVEGRIEALCERLGLEEPDLHAVRRRVERLDGWTEDFRRSETLSHRVSELRKTLEPAPDLLEASTADLEARTDACREAEERERELGDRISRLRQRIEDSSKGRRLHEAREKLERCRERLREDREAALHTWTGIEILDWLREGCRTRERPELLEEANRNLTLFTGGTLRLTLSMEGERGEFLASRPGHPARSLDRLSTGERSQLLMAVRLAFLHLHERAPLPLFVDEALGTSDDGRARRIMRALIRIAREGRQLFYFTAQEDEVAKWLGAAREEDVELRVIDLGRLRRGGAARDFNPPEATPAPREPLRRGEDESLEAWARRLEIPGWSPRGPVEDLPLWYPLRKDGDSLATLMEHGIHTWGALKAFRDAGAAEGLVGASLLERIQLQVKALEALAGAWRVGRPPPVPEREIAESGAVSEKFLPPVLELLDQVDGDAEALIRRLEAKAVSGFRQRKIDDLRNHLYDRGHLVDETPLTRIELRARAYGALENPEALSPADWDRLMDLLPLNPNEGTRHD